MKVSLVPLLLANREICAEARQALVEGRFQEAAALLWSRTGSGALKRIGFRTSGCANYAGRSLAS